MKKAIILHGMPSKKSFKNEDRDSQIFSHWLPWLHQKLSVRDILAQVPSMPKPYAPVYEDWKNVIKRFDIDENTTLIGHSCGAGFFVRYLSENDIKVDKLILVAPWLDPEKEIGDFFDFNINLEGKSKSLHIFHSTDDFDGVQKSFHILKEKLPQAEIHMFDDMGHFVRDDMGTEEFPELLDVVLI